VILDEPTTGLDPEQRASLRGILSGLAGTGTVLLSTHQTEDVAALCDRVIVLDDGAIRFDGTVANLITTARGRVHVDLAAAPGALNSWRTGTGTVRSVGGRAGLDAELVEPTVEDAYLLLRGEPNTTQGAAS
jgi:ABC-2 type transport system ATP-binding protein